MGLLILIYLVGITIFTSYCISGRKESIERPSGAENTSPVLSKKKTEIFPEHIYPWHLFINDLIFFWVGVRQDHIPVLFVVKSALLSTKFIRLQIIPMICFSNPYQFSVIANIWISLIVTNFSFFSPSVFVSSLEPFSLIVTNFSFFPPSVFVSSLEPFSLSTICFNFF